jgi:ribosomal protein S18 acetylase RimI-like enzyme
MGCDIPEDDLHQITRLRKASGADAAIFTELEQSAGLSFRADQEIAWLADADNVSADRYREIIAEGWSWIAESERVRPVGFVAATLEGDELHIWEFGVRIEYQRRGIGRRLLQRLLAEAIAAKIPAMTLTTFRDLPWNAPFYQSMSFELLNSAQLNPRLTALLSKEARMGLPAARRCAMRRKLVA